MRDGGETTASRLFAGLALLLAALNQRAALSSVGPVLPDLMRGTGIGTTQASLLTTAPILCLGLFGLAAPPLARRLGAERSVVVMLGLIVAGLLLRLAGTWPALIASTVPVGLGIGTLNVVMPSLIKRDFPDRVGAAMGVYTLCLVGGASVAIGATQPLSRALGGSWAEALAFWAVPAALAMVAWLPRAGAGPAVSEARRPPGLWRSPLAWQISIYFAIQSLLFYALIAWLPTMLRERGMDPAAAGLVMSLGLAVQVVPALLTPAWAARMRDQRTIAVAVVIGTMVGYVGMTRLPLAQAWLWVVVMGLSQGANLAVALTLLVLRARQPAGAAALSGMAQGVGYSLAGAGPLLVGLLHGWTGGWVAGDLALAAFAAICVGCGLGAGRARVVDG